MPWEALRGAASLTAQLWWLSCHTWLSCLHSLCERGSLLEANAWDAMFAMFAHTAQERLGLRRL